MDFHDLTRVNPDTANQLLRSLRSVMAQHGVLRLQSRAGQRGHLGLEQGAAHPVDLHLTWAHQDDLSRLRQAAALPTDMRRGERDEMTFYGDLLMALLRMQVRRVEFGVEGGLAFIPDAREVGGLAFRGEGLVFTPR
ncbi:hypothetical protein [Deinococcus sp. NW-56]|uniref:hypothetical protein n=1 Tax=Deinococcus sp. NW-56 TaxID=2080419 RepID=UPI000CF5342B|nr:hypothetical protein [Deinococcus sp. NW-56]